MTEKYEFELQQATEAVRLACEICRNVRSQISADALEKADRSPVTVADFASQAAVCRKLGEALPDDPIVAEEDSAELRKPENRAFLDQVGEQLAQVQVVASDNSEICRWIDRGNASGASERFWTLDPIDGTKGFLRGGQYAIALALIVDGRVEIAVLGCPSLPVEPAAEQPFGVMMTAVRGRGAAMTPLDETTTAQPVRVSKIREPAQARFCESVEAGHSSHDRSAKIAEWLGISRSPVRLDSQAKYATVARGETDVYLRLPTRSDYIEKIWDHTAGVLIVEEAGGTVTDVSGRPLEFHHGPLLQANRGVVVTNGLLHERVLEAVTDSD